LSYGRTLFFQGKPAHYIVQNTIQNLK